MGKPFLPATGDKAPPLASELSPKATLQATFTARTSASPRSIGCGSDGDVTFPSHRYLADTPRSNCIRRHLELASSEKPSLLDASEKPDETVPSEKSSGPSRRAAEAFWAPERSFIDADTGEAESTEEVALPAGDPWYTGSL